LAIRADRLAVAQPAPRDDDYRNASVRAVREGGVRQAPNLDGNHTEIVNAFRGLGASVISLAAVGHGCPDILVGYDCGALKINLLVEIKNFNEGTVKGELSDDQAKWHKDWRGQVAIVRSLEDVGFLIKAARYHAGMIEAERA
jgi:hypothetical protein